MMFGGGGLGGDRVETAMMEMVDGRGWRWFCVADGDEDDDVNISYQQSTQKSQTKRVMDEPNNPGFHALGWMDDHCSTVKRVCNKRELIRPRVKFWKSLNGMRLGMMRMSRSV